MILSRPLEATWLAFHPNLPRALEKMSATMMMAVTCAMHKKTRITKDEVCIG